MFGETSHSPPPPKTNPTSVESISVAQANAGGLQQQLITEPQTETAFPLYLSLKLKIG
jgi:hypothetical protein